MGDKQNELSFEVALEKLEGLVESMENGDVSLAELVAKFEQGNKLLSHCEKQLKDAELKIEMLRKEKETVSTEAFEAPAAE